MNIILEDSNLKKVKNTYLIMLHNGNQHTGYCASSSVYGVSVHSFALTIVNIYIQPFRLKICAIAATRDLSIHKSTSHPRLNVIFSKIIKLKINYIRSITVSVIYAFKK